MKTGDEQYSELSPDKTGSVLSLGTASTATLGHASIVEDNTCRGRCRRGFQKVKGVYKVCRNVVGLAILLGAYSVLGAVIFMYIEGDHEKVHKMNITSLRETMVESLYKASLLNHTEGGWSDLASDMLVEYEDIVRAAAKQGVNTPSNVNTWNFWSCLFFVGTIYTTIGYGNMAPVTDLGRGVCMLYAAVGIPLALLFLAEVGRRFTIALKFLWAFVRRYKQTGYCRKIRRPMTNKYKLSDEHMDAENKPIDERSRSGSMVVYGYEIDDEFNLPISIAVIILLVYMMLGGFMYTQWENWTLLEATYFVFISIFTIGFGDVLPEHPKFFILSSVYILIGLSLVSMCVNVAIEFFSKQVDRAKQKMGEAKQKMGEAKQKMIDAKSKIGEKVNQAGKNAKDRVTEIRTNIKDETAKIRHMTDERFKKKGHSSSRSGTPASTDSSSDKRCQETQSVDGETAGKTVDGEH